ncbi:hypothetical protein SXCC_00318 [Gluconacetobacter sp. SXCC-1]|nr:hypothetical protein SXCC_00318 [Gluconacetobacter sp. SXCC-1]
MLGNYIQQADHILAGMFTRNPDVTGITFPAPHGRAAHTATPDDPHVLPHDRALTAIMDARQRGEITADEMIAQIGATTRPRSVAACWPGATPPSRRHRSPITAL